MPKKYIIANWKMNGDHTLIQQYHDFFSKHHLDYHVIVCPPYPFLEPMRHDSYHVGAQDCHFEQSGAFTGSISPSILKSIGTEYTILGHSERRIQHNENSSLIQKKAIAAINENLIPIICVGETLEEKNNGKTESVIKKQLTESIPETTEPLLIAYEPVWAIGTGKTPSTQDIKDIHTLIHTLYPTRPVLYGGSVNQENIEDILKIKHVDGVLVGGASLDISFFQLLT